MDYSYLYVAQVVRAPCTKMITTAADLFSFAFGVVCLDWYFVRFVVEVPGVEMFNCTVLVWKTSSFSIAQAPDRRRHKYLEHMVYYLVYLTGRE